MNNFLPVLLSAILLFAGNVYPKKAIHFKGNLEIGKSVVSISKENFRNANTLHKSKSATKPVRVLVLIDSSFNKNSLSQYGWKFLSFTGNEIAMLEGPIETAQYLSSIEGILHVKMPSKIYPNMDFARKFTHVDEVHGNAVSNLPESYLGQGVLVGILETEFDTHHPAFLDSTGSTRFAAIWDQSDSSGPQTKYGYGTIKNHDQIDADPSFALSAEMVHGTSITGFAAGSIVGSNPYYGVAPKSALAGVRYSGADNDIIDGIKWIFSIADSLKMPCVINMSIGTSCGPHDGSSLIDRAIDSMSGSGRIIVGAAGNDGDKRSHISFVLKNGETKGTWISPLQGKLSSGKEISQGGIDIWGTPGLYFTATFQVIDTSTMAVYNLQPSVSTILNRQFADTLYCRDSINNTVDTLYFAAQSERRSALNKKVHLEAILTSKNKNHYLGVKFSSSSSSADTIQAWNIYKKSFEDFTIDDYYCGDMTMSVNEVGGTSKRNITVGAYTSNLNFKLWNGALDTSSSPMGPIQHYSGIGPTADGRLKPDICAPGSNVAGPLSSAAGEEHEKSIVIWPDTTTKEGRYAYTGGTSVASPIVAGIVALMLQVDGTLTPEEIKKIFSETAIKDEYTGALTTPDNIWGYGKVNALSSIQTLLNITKNKIKVNNNPDKQIISILRNALKINGDLSAYPECTATWYTINGKVMCRQKIGPDQIIQYPKSANSQVYVLKLNTPLSARTFILKK